MMSHDVIEQKFKAKLDQLSCNPNYKVYYHLANGMISVNASMYVSLSDQPERRENCNITHGMADLAPGLVILPTLSVECCLPFLHATHLYNI